MGPNKWPRKLSTPSSSWHLPLYVPNVETAATDKVVQESEDPRLAQIWKSLEELPQPERIVHEETRKSSLCEDDVKAILKDPRLAELAGDDELVTAVAFSVDEVKKGRRRFLVWPRILNQILGHTAQFEIASIEQVIAIVSKALEDESQQTFGLTADLKAAFFQHAITKKLGAWLVFSIRGKKIRLKVLPMGFVSSPEIQQRISLAISRLIRQPILKNPTERVVYLDNFAFFGVLKDMNSAKGLLQHLCSRYSVTLGAEPQVEQVFPFLGLNFNLASKEVTVSDKSIEKLTAIKVGNEMDWRSFVSMVGLLFFCSSVLQIPLAQFYYAFKAYREFCAHPSAKVTLHKNSREQFVVWQQVAMANAPRSLKALPQAAWTLFTDASDEGFAIVLFQDMPSTHIFTYYKTWSEARWWKDPKFLPPIAQREAYPVLVAGRLLREMGIPTEQVNLRIDNLTTMFSLKKQYSREYHLNNMIAHAPRFRSIQYVESKANLADPFTRGQTDRQNQDNFVI